MVFFGRELKFKQEREIKANYIHDILVYFSDTFDIMFCGRKSNSLPEKFSNQIGLLQSIYVQQDFVEELLRIFKTGIEKGDLKKDPNYSINRDIRNELIGHPIRRENGNGALISTCLFASCKESDKVAYGRYHRDNDYKYETIDHTVSEIIFRHKQFLNKYNQLSARFICNLDASLL